MLLISLSEAVTQLQEQFGRIQVQWGEVYRARRGDESWPVSGVAREGGGRLVTLRVVSSKKSDPDVYENLIPPDENEASYK